MAQFYGKLQGNRGEATRCGTKASGITTYAASWAGAVRVRVSEHTDGTEWAFVELIPWHGRGVLRELYSGPVSGASASEEAS